jgi:hypothetical protein
VQKGIQVRTNRHFLWLICLRILQVGSIQLWNQEDNCTREKASHVGLPSARQNNKHVSFFLFPQIIFLYTHTLVVHIRYLIIKITVILIHK